MPPIVFIPNQLQVLSQRGCLAEKESDGPSREERGAPQKDGAGSLGGVWLG